MHTVTQVCLVLLICSVLMIFFLFVLLLFTWYISLYQYMVYVEISCIKLHPMISHLEHNDQCAFSRLLHQFPSLLVPIFCLHKHLILK